MKITQRTLNSWLLDERKKGDTLKCGHIGGLHIRVNRDSPKMEKAPGSYRVKYRINSVKQGTFTSEKCHDFSLYQARTSAGLLKMEDKMRTDRRVEREKEQSEAKARQQAKASKLPRHIGFSQLVDDFGNS